MNKPLIHPVGEFNTAQESEKILAEIGKVLGKVPNLARTVAHSHAALQSLWNQMIATTQMQLSTRIQVGIALRVSEINGCAYCLAAHTTLGKDSGIDTTTLQDFRLGKSNDQKEQALLALATKIIKDRGHHAGFVVETARSLGITSAQISEVIALIVLNTFTDYISSVADTPIDFPMIDSINGTLGVVPGQSGGGDEGTT